MLTMGGAMLRGTLGGGQETANPPASNHETTVAIRCVNITYDIIRYCCARSDGADH